MTTTTQIIVTKADGIATITLNRPEKMNAYTRTMGEEIIAAMDDIDADDAVRAVIFTGSGERAFCAGADLTPEGGGQVFSDPTQVDDLSEDGPQPACPVEVVHEVRAGRLQVDEQWHAGAAHVEIVQAEIHTETSGNREQMNDRVRRAPDHGERDDRVLKGSLCHDGARAAVCLDKLDGQPPGGVGTFEQPAVGGWGAGDVVCIGVSLCFFAR